MILCLIPIGLFVAVLPKSSTDREAFLSAHQSLGLTVLALVFFRLAWLRISPAPALSVWIDFLGALSGALDSGVSIPDRHWVSV